MAIFRKITAAIVGAAAAGMILLVAGWFTPGAIKDYQKQRLISFIDPEINPHSPASYNARQATLAVTGGGLVGQGLGFAILATRPASTVSYDGRLLVTRPLLVDTRPSRVMLVSRKGAKLSPQAERFHWFCRDFFDLN